MAQSRNKRATEMMIIAAEAASGGVGVGVGVGMTTVRDVVQGEVPGH